jgi:hypothetical protein
MVSFLFSLITASIFSRFDLDRVSTRLSAKTTVYHQDGVVFAQYAHEILDYIRYTCCTALTRYLTSPKAEL